MVKIKIYLNVLTVNTQLLSFNSSLHLPNPLAVPKVASNVTSKSKHSHDSCSRRAAFVFRLGCNFTEHFESNFEKTKRLCAK